MHQEYQNARTRVKLYTYHDINIHNHDSILYVQKLMACGCTQESIDYLKEKLSSYKNNEYIIFNDHKERMVWTLSEIYEHI